MITMAKMFVKGSAPWSMRIIGFVAAALLALLLAATPSGSVEPGQAPATKAPEQPPAFVTLDGRKVIEIRAAVGAQTPQQMARRGSQSLAQIASDYAISPDQLVLREAPPYTEIGLFRGGRFVIKLAVDERNANLFQQSRQELAQRYLEQIRASIKRYRSTHRGQDWLRGTALALLTLGGYVLWLRGQLALNRRLAAWIHAPANPRLDGVQIGGSELLAADQERTLLDLLRRGVNAVVLAVVSYLFIPLFLGLFPPTQAVSETLKAQILRLISGALNAFVASIPDLITLALILAFTVVLVRASNAWFRSIELQRLRLSWFYPEWARPTARLVAIMILLGGLVFAYPYVPGTSSKAFQGAGLFLGVLAALGSSAVASNLIGGLMLTYTRAYQEGDRVKINDTIGIVEDTALLTTRLRTPWNELVNIPNATVLGASIVNYTLARRELGKPVVIAATVTIGYDVPWRQVHQLMLDAAHATAGISQELPAFVLQTSLNDFHISYELNACVENVDTYRLTFSGLLAAIQDQFAAAGVEILSPGYHAIRNGNRSTVPKVTGQDG